jgi:hypothetical protein
LTLSLSLGFSESFSVVLSIAVVCSFAVVWSSSFLVVGFCAGLGFGLVLGEIDDLLLFVSWFITDLPGKSLDVPEEKKFFEL